MSEYCKEKVLRYPVDEDIDLYEFEMTHKEYFAYKKSEYFQIAPTERKFIDYVIYSTYDCEGDFGKTRSLTENEKNKYRSIWEKIIPNIDMNKVRVVEYCWYDATEAPGYYDDIDDPFYTEEV